MLTLAAAPRHLLRRLSNTKRATTLHVCITALQVVTIRMFAQLFGVFTQVLSARGLTITACLSCFKIYALRIPKHMKNYAILCLSCMSKVFSLLYIRRPNMRNTSLRYYPMQLCSRQRSSIPSCQMSLPVSRAVYNVHFGSLRTT